MVSGCKFLLSEPLEYQAFAFRSMFLTQAMSNWGRAPADDVI